MCRPASLLELSCATQYLQRDCEGAVAQHMGGGRGMRWIDRFKNDAGVSTTFFPYSHLVHSRVRHLKPCC